MKPCKSCRNYESEISRLQEEMAALSKSNDAALESKAALTQQLTKICVEHLRLAEENKESGVLISKYLIENQDLRDLCVRLRKIADLAGKMADAELNFQALPERKNWLGQTIFSDFENGLLLLVENFARDIRTMLAAEAVDSAIHRKAEK